MVQPAALGISIPIGAEVLLSEKTVAEQMSDLGFRARARVDIPVTDRHTLRQAADLLHGLATRIEVASRRTDVEERSALIQAALDIKATNKKLLALQKSKKYTRASDAK